jgi:hypothetical protein
LPNNNDLLAFGFPLPPALRHLEGAQEEKRVVQEVVEEVDKKPAEKLDDDDEEEEEEGGGEITEGGISGAAAAAAAAAPNESRSSRSSKNNNKFAQWRGVADVWTEGYEAYLDQQEVVVEVEVAEEEEEEEGWWTAKRSSPTTQQPRGVVGGCGSSSISSKVKGNGTGPYWCNLCGCPVASQASLVPHQKQCSRKLAATSAQCPTCHWPVLRLVD